METRFVVTPKYQGGYNISIGVGKLFSADTLQAVVYGMEHYFNKAIPAYSKEPFNRADHYAHQKECSCCPLCK